MTRAKELKIFIIIALIGVFFSAAVSAFGQSAVKPARTIFIDSEGHLIPNNEFVDLRLANPSGPDIATRTIRDDGMIEFRLAAVPQEGTTAPMFEAPLLGNGAVNSNKLLGKVVVLNFWFIGCPGCVSEMPKLNAMAAKFASDPDVEFIAIAPNSERELHEFLARERFDYKIVGQARSIINLFAFNGFPRNIVVGRDGRIAYWRTTIRAWDKFESVIRAELSK